MHESNLPSKAISAEDGCSPKVPGAISHHAAEDHGCSHARSMFARVCVASARRQWRVLPSLPPMCRRLSVRLENDAPWKPGGNPGCGDRGAAALNFETTDLGASCAPLETGRSYPISSKQPEHIVCTHNS